AANGGAAEEPRQHQCGECKAATTRRVGASRQLGPGDSAHDRGHTSRPRPGFGMAKLGEAQPGAGGAAKADKALATQHYQAAAVAYQRAVQLKPTNGAYHNNLGQAYAKSGKPQEALGEYTAAAQADPTDAAIYYFNLGAILTNQATSESNATTKAKDIEDANIAFDKAIAAKP